MYCSEITLIFVYKDDVMLVANFQAICIRHNLNYLGSITIDTLSMFVDMDILIILVRGACTLS
jgi:hypothetical protein